MGYKWVTNGLQMGYKWVTNGLNSPRFQSRHEKMTSGLQLGYKWVTNGLQMGYKMGYKWVKHWLEKQTFFFQKNGVCNHNYVVITIHIYIYILLRSRTRIIYWQSGLYNELKLDLQQFATQQSKATMLSVVSLPPTHTLSLTRSRTITANAPSHAQQAPPN
jgi:hypothetical protein